MGRPSRVVLVVDALNLVAQRGIALRPRRLTGGADLAGAMTVNTSMGRSATPRKSARPRSAPDDR